MINNMDDPHSAGDHPALVDLADLADGRSVQETVADHAAGCGQCQAIVTEFSVRPGEGEIDVDLDEVVAIAPGVTTLLQDEAVDREPAQGDLWQLEWEGIAQLVAVVGIDSDRYRVSPVTAEEPADPAGVVVVDAAASQLNVALHAWPTVAFDVPLGVFLRWAGAMGEQTLVRMKEAPATPSWAATLLHLDLLPAAEWLAGASWVPEPATLTSEPLRELLLARKLRPSDVAARTRLRAADVTAMLQGRREATETEADELASLLDVPVDVVRRPLELPTSLVRAIERPAHRAAVRLRAIRDRISEGSARLTVARAVLAMPARTSTADRDVDAWDQLVRQHLDG